MSRQNFEIKTVNHKDWSNGLIARFSKRFALIPVGAVVSLITGLFRYTTAAVAMAAVTFLGVAVAAVLLATVRRYRIKRSVFGEYLHNMEDAVRELLVPLCRRARDRVNIDGEAKHFWSTVAGHVAQYFGVLLHNAESRTGCLIWLKNGDIFCVVGRGGQITTDARTLRPIEHDSNKGIIRQLVTQMKQRGVFVINSLAEALQAGAWEAVGIEELQCVKSVAVVPINAPGINGRLLGLLMITSDEANVFQPTQAEYLKAMADRFATYALLTEVDESPSSTLGFEPSKYVRMTPEMNFTTLFSGLQAGQTLYWLDTFCPSYRAWLPDLSLALARGARVRMLLLDTNSQSARDRASELAKSYGEQPFLDDLTAFNEAMRKCQREATTRHGGSLALVMYGDLLGDPTYIVCDDSDEPIYGYSGEYLGNPSASGRHYCWNAHHLEVLRERRDYVQSKMRKNDPQKSLFDRTAH
jgi:hypothetical protein